MAAAKPKVDTAKLKRALIATFVFTTILAGAAFVLALIATAETRRLSEHLEFLVNATGARGAYAQYEYTQTRALLQQLNPSLYYRMPESARDYCCAYLSKKADASWCDLFQCVTNEADAVQVNVATYVPVTPVTANAYTSAERARDDEL